MGVGERRKANGRNDFEENRDCIAYHIKGSASCGTDDFETVMRRFEIISAAVCCDCQSRTVPDWYSSQRLRKEARNMWRYKFFKAHKSAKEKRMMAYYYGVK